MIYLSGTIPKTNLETPETIPNEIGLMLTCRKNAGRKNPFPFMFSHPWGADNNCFNDPDFDLSIYLKFLENMKPVAKNCLFAPAPDVVGDADATIERSYPVLPQIRAAGFPAAFVAQNGVENMAIRWDFFDCLFIGGDDNFKESDAVAYLCREAMKRQKWIHCGRVNSLRRLILMQKFGCDSVDGTFVAFGPDKNFPIVVDWIKTVNSQPMQPILNFWGE
jgi:hypothetical protein